MIRLSALILLALSQIARADLADSINFTALQTKDSINLYTKNDKVYLYGIQTNGKDTKNGHWACAKVVSIILIKSGVNIPIQLGVCGIESKLSNWKKVRVKDSLIPGDIVVWTSFFKGNKNKACTGGGTCHVGIYTDNGYFHNSPLSKEPTFNGISLWGFKFKYALRPPKTLKDNE